MDTAARPPYPHISSSSSSPSHGGLLRSLAKLVRLHRRSGSKGAAGAGSGSSGELDNDDVRSRTTSGTAVHHHHRSAGGGFFFKPSRLKQSGPLNLDGSSVYSRSEAVREEDVKRQNRGREAGDTVLAMVFAAVSAIKAAYAQLQLAQAPYDPEAVQAADVAVVAELKRISQIKHWYFGTKHQYPADDYQYQQVQVQMLSPDAHVVAEILEMRSLIKTYQVTTKKLENELRNKDEEVARLGEELKEAEGKNRELENKVRALLVSTRKNVVPTTGATNINAATATNATSHHHYQHQRRRHHRSMSTSFSAFPGMVDDHTGTTNAALGGGGIVVDLEKLTPALFIDGLRRAVKSARSFTRELVREMQNAGWDVYAAAAAIAPDVVALAGAGEEHLELVLQSYICRRMFSAFQYPQFKPGREKSKTCDIRRRRERFLEEYVEMEHQPQQGWGTGVDDDSGGSIGRRYFHASAAFEEFIRDKYRAVVHPRMEVAFFGGVAGVGGGLGLSFPSTAAGAAAPRPFFRCFQEMARRVWMLQRLFHAFEPEAGAALYDAPKGSRFSEVYMQSVWPATEPDTGVMVVGFTVVPGFKIRGTVIPCRVYLAAAAEGDADPSTTAAVGSGWSSRSR